MRSLVSILALIGVALGVVGLVPRAGVAEGRSLAGAPAAAPAPTPTPPPGITPIDLTIALEWLPGTEDDLQAEMQDTGCKTVSEKQKYIEDLQQGVRGFAKYLYYYTEGQMALRTVTITDSVGWDQADIRIFASSDYRPNAFVGGVTPVPTARPDSTNPTALFYPGPIRLGRLWDGSAKDENGVYRWGARCGAWSKPAGWRTIGHEFGHYALYLFDEYFDVTTSKPLYCTSGALDRHVLGDPNLDNLADSLMAFQYSADKLWWRARSTDPTPETCKGTSQTSIYGMSDWETLTTFPPRLSARKPRTDIVFEGSPVDEPGFLNFQIDPSLKATGKTSARVNLNPIPANQQMGWAYVVRPNGNGIPQRIIGQGVLVGGDQHSLPFYGIQASADRASVDVQETTTGQHYAYPARADRATPLVAGSAQILTASATTWRPQLTISPVVRQVPPFDRTTGLRVRFVDNARSTTQLELLYCPAGGDCRDRVILTGRDSFEHVFDYSAAIHNIRDEPPALSGYIYARNIDTQEEIVVWYELAGGGGSAHIPTFAPLADALVQVEIPPGSAARAAIPSAAPAATGPTERVLYHPAQVPAATKFPAGVLGLVGTPFAIQPVIATQNGGRGWGSAPSDAPLRVRLAYTQDLLDRRGVDESQLVVMRLDTSSQQQVWQELATIGQDPALDWITAEPQLFHGNGEIYALGYRRSRVLLPLIMN